MTDTTQAKASLTIREHKFKQYRADHSAMVTHWDGEHCFHVQIFSEVYSMGLMVSTCAGIEPSAHRGRHKRAVISSAIMLGVETGRISESDASLLMAAAMEEEAV